MKRSGQQKPFRTIGSRMRDFGRSMMRHYVPPQELPSFFADEPPPPAWSNAAQTPLVWPEPPAPAGFADETPPDAGFTGDQGESFTQDFAQQPQQPRRRPQNPQQPPLPPSVQRKPAPAPQPQQPTSVDQRLKNILAMHQAKEAERQRIREEKKSAFEAAEIQRQSDPEAPRRPRRMSVDYIETSSLARGEDQPAPRTPPAQPVQREPETSAPPLENLSSDEPPISDDTERLDPSVIQASLDTISLQRELRGEVVEDEGDDYIPAGDEDAQAFFDKPSDWDEDSGDDNQGTPPPMDVPPAPMPPSGNVQRMPKTPSEPDSGDASETNTGSWSQETDYPYQSDLDASDAPPASDTITLSPDRAQRVQRDYQGNQAEAEPDFGSAGNFEPAPTDDSADTDFLNPPTETVQRDYEAQSAPDFTTDTGSFQEADAHYQLPTFEMDEGDTRPVNIQRAPILPPPDFEDDVDVPPAETGYSSLADWVDAQSEQGSDSGYENTPPAPERPVSSQRPGTVQRDFEAAVNRVAPDFSLQTGDFNQADFERSEQTAATSFDMPDISLDTDEGDTRPLDVQRTFHEPDFADSDDDSDQSGDFDGGMGYENASAFGLNANSDTGVPVQRDYQPADDMPDAQGYIEPADAREFFDEAVYSDAAEPEANAGWGGAVSDQPPADVVQRDFESESTPVMPVEADDPAETFRFDVQDYAVDDPADTGYENPAGEWRGDIDAPPAADIAHTVQRSDAMPDFEPDDEQPAYTDETYYDEASAPDGDVYTPPVSDTSAVVQREYDPFADLADDYDAAQAYENVAPVADDAGEYESFSAPQENAEAGWNGDVNAAPSDAVQREYDDASQAYENVAPGIDDRGEYEPSPVQQDDAYHAPFADTYAPYHEDAGEILDGYTDQTDAPAWDGAAFNQTQADGSNAVQRDYEPAYPMSDEPEYGTGAETYSDAVDEPPADWGWQSAPPADQPPPTDAVQRDYDATTMPPTPDTYSDTGYDAGYDAGGEPPMDIYQAMMDAGMIPSDSGWDGGDGGGLSPESIQRTPDTYTPDQPVDLYQAMMQSGMIPPSPDMDMPVGTAESSAYYPPEPNTGMSAETRTDLLSLLDMPTPRTQSSASDVSQNSNIISRVYEPPPSQPNPPVVQRAETENESDNGQNPADDVDVDQLARDVYSVLRNRLRIERERRDRKP